LQNETSFFAHDLQTSEHTRYILTAIMAQPSKDIIEDITTRFILTAPSEQLECAL
jgi:hypothetical protein